jgi:hypothetical protein
VRLLNSHANGECYYTRLGTLYTDAGAGELSQRQSTLFLNRHSAHTATSSGLRTSENVLERLVAASPVMTISLDPRWGEIITRRTAFVKPPRRGTRALSPAGMFGGKAPLRLQAQKCRLRAPSEPMRSAPAYFLCKWGVLTRLDLLSGYCSFGQ